MDIQLVILVVGAMGAAIAFWAIREDQQNKRIEKLSQGWKEFALDKDGDGLVQEGTPFERRVAKPKAKAKAKPVKKAVAKKKAVPAKKKKAVAPKKKVTKAPVKKKAVAKKKSR